MENYYAQFDELMALCQNVKQMVLAHAETLANEKAERVEYSTPSLLLGLYTPTLLLGIGYSNAFKKGKKLKSPGDRTDYFSYEYNAEEKLLRITNHGDSLRFFYCIIEHAGYEWAVPIYLNNGNYYEYPYDVMVTKRDAQGRVLLFGRIRSSMLWLEKYRYSWDDSSTAVCEMWFYRPNLIWSSKAIPVHETGTPAQLWIYRLDLSDPKKTRGELIESYTYDPGYYNSKDDMPPTQIVYKKE